MVLVVNASSVNLKIPSSKGKSMIELIEEILYGKEDHYQSFDSDYLAWIDKWTKERQNTLDAIQSLSHRHTQIQALRIIQIIRRVFQRSARLLKCAIGFDMMLISIPTPPTSLRFMLDFKTQSRKGEANERKA